MAPAQPTERKATRSLDGRPFQTRAQHGYPKKEALGGNVAAASNGNRGAELRSEPAPGPAKSPTASGAVPIAMAVRGPIYTATAAQGFDSAQLINAALANKVVGKHNPRRLLVADPAGPSTSGGKHARQTITLVPVSGEGGTVMCGWLDVAKKAAGLRDYRSVGDQFRGRYGHALDITPEEYLGIVRELEVLMKTIGVAASHEVTEPAKQAAQVAQKIAVVEADEPEEGLRPLTIGLAAVLLVMAVGSIVWMLQ